MVCAEIQQRVPAARPRDALCRFSCRSLRSVTCPPPKKGDDGTWLGAGHFVVGVGFLRMQDGTNYIHVYDGWNGSTYRYYNPNATSMDWTRGVSVRIS